MIQKEDIRRYWDEFYANSAKRPPTYPSQFAAFVAGEIPEKSPIVEYGCGSGRDTEFFASLGHEILALDGSASAIERCRKYSDGRATYLNADIANSKMLLKDFISRHEFVVLYARFFLHAIPEEEENGFLKILSELLKPSSLVAFEYRTREDVESEKSFGNHFRRFLDHNAFCNKMAASGFEVLYQIKGRGLAKYKTEDAEVGRIVCRK